MEAAHFFKWGEIVDYSEQQLIDCSTSEGNNGCNGGNTLKAYRYIYKNALEYEETYPYVGREQTCKHHQQSLMPGLKNAWYYAKHSELTMMELLRKHGPLAIFVCSANRAWQHYSYGIISASECGDCHDHLVLLTGYKMDRHFIVGDYWMVKNSWGTGWG
jgi:cathepsin L